MFYIVFGCIIIVFYVVFESAFIQIPFKKKQPYQQSKYKIKNLATRKHRDLVIS